MTIPYPPTRAVEKAIAARGVNVVINEFAVEEARLRIAAGRDRQGRQERVASATSTGIVNITVIGVVGDTRFRSVRTPIEPIMFRKVTAGPGLDDHPLQRRSRDGPRGRRAAVEADHQRRAVQRQVQRGHHRRAVQEGGCAGADLRRLLAAGGDHRLPRPVRPRRLHRASGGPRRSASARCLAPARATSSGCWCGSSAGR